MTKGFESTPSSSLAPATIQSEAVAGRLFKTPPWWWGSWLFIYVEELLPPKTSQSSSSSRPSPCLMGTHDSVKIPGYSFIQYDYNEVVMAKRIFLFCFLLIEEFSFPVPAPAPLPAVGAPPNPYSHSFILIVIICSWALLCLWTIRHTARDTRLVTANRTTGLLGNDD